MQVQAIPDIVIMSSPALPGLAWQKIPTRAHGAGQKASRTVSVHSY